MTVRSLSWLDYVVIGGYFVFVLAVGLISSRRSKGDSISGYFLASRNMHWIPVGASLFASNIGSGHFIGLAGSGAASGIGIAAFELNAIYALVLLGWVFVPVYMSSGVYTMPEYLRERFGGQRIRVYLSVLALLLYVFTKISADLYAGALFIQEAIGRNSQEWFYLSVLILLAISALFTITGGLTAVIWTDFVQVVLMVVGAFVLMFKSFEAVGGYEKLPDQFLYSSAANVSKQYDSCAYPPSYSMNFFRSATPGESDLPWTGSIFGVAIACVWYFCTDQVIVQRTLASKTMVYAKSGCLLAAALKFLPLWLLVFPGMAARVLFPDEVACVEPEKCKSICGSEGGCTNIAYVKLVLELLPNGLRGMMLAVMMAALMSSLTSIFNSASTIFTMDIWIRVRSKAFKKKSLRDIEVEQLIVGRVFVLALVAISVIWIPVIQGSANSQLFMYIQSISSFLSPPICAVYLLAIFWRRTTEPGAFWGLMTGLVVGIVRFTMEFSFTVPPCGSMKPDLRPEIIKLLVGNLHFLNFSILLWALTMVVTIAVSYLTEPIPEKCLPRLTFSTRRSTEPRVSIRMVMDEEDAQDNDLAAKLSQTVSPTLKKESTLKKLLYRMCGYSETTAATLENDNVNCESKSEAERILEAVKFLEEEPTQKLIVNGLAIFCMMMASGVLGYYA
ncbi:sodium/glucose cotransporter 5 [Hyalella azteca]|uniref:Sodium/glucose cotransporter 5 n=1 Tax=Hyalella azteca TaxID=294128 RepID=A0A8B7PH26_HYAAZ|nr:sodium/glucose cotransporter 5 [Hyalella azteca]